MAFWGRYVSVGERRANAQRELDKLRKKGIVVQPVEISGRTIAKSFWGKGWCKHLESFSDYANRLPRGRTYARNGSVCHLEIQEGMVTAMVSGSSLYQVKVDISALPESAWAIVSDRNHGLFPRPKEIELSCSCPDWATMCKHVAAVLYGVGNRLDNEPELLFLLRGVKPEELIAADLSFASVSDDDQLPDEQLADIFGLDLEFELVETDDGPI